MLLSLTIPSIESLVVAIQKLRRDIIRGTKTPISKLTVTYQPSPPGTCFHAAKSKIHSEIKHMTMSHWDGTPPTGRGERSTHYVQPPVPANVDIQVKKHREKIQCDSFNTVISDISQVNLEYDYHGLPGEE